MNPMESCHTSIDNHVHPYQILVFILFISVSLVILSLNQIEINQLPKDMIESGETFAELYQNPEEEASILAETENTASENTGQVYSEQIGQFKEENLPKEYSSKDPSPGKALPFGKVAHLNTEHESNLPQSHNRIVNEQIAFKPNYNVAKLNNHVVKPCFSNCQEQNLNATYPDLFKSWWNSGMTVFCDGAFVGYGSETAVLHNVVMNRAHALGRKGGENFQLLWQQKEEDEYFKYTYGFLEIPCATRPKYFFSSTKNHNNFWMDNMTLAQNDDKHLCERSLDGYYLAITRYEYVNIYYTMADLYNAFLAMKFFNLTREMTNIILVDCHPSGGLDSVWSSLFNSVRRLSDLPEKTCFKNLIFGILGYNSLMIWDLATQHVQRELPLHGEFRDFFLTSFTLPTTLPLICNQLSILIVWRRPYLAHPRNPSGNVERKIKNEEELLDQVQKSFPQFKVDGVQLDQYEFRNQLKYVSQTDILIGMHGAGLTLSLFMSPGRGLIELFPAYASPEVLKHFQYMAQWRGLFHKKWVNLNAVLEAPDYYTYVPPTAVVNLVKEVIQDMCSN